MSKFLYIDETYVKYNLYYLKQLVFEVTDLCNLKCKYCGFAELYQGYDDREGKMITFSKAKQIIDYLVLLWREVYSPSANFPVTIGFYGGEPLINMPFIKETIDYLKKIQDCGKCFSFNMTTNAMLLDRYMDYLVEKDFQLLISLDGDEYAHSYRIDHSGKNSFHQVFRNIIKLRDKYPEYFDKKVRFNSVLHNRNNVESIYQFIKENFDKTPSIAPLTGFGIRKDKVSEFKTMYQNMQSMYRSEKCGAIEAEMFTNTPRVLNLARHIHRRSGNVFNSYNDLLVDSSNSDFAPTGTCLPFAKKIFITVNGKILPCERIDHDFFYGNVYDDHVELDLIKVAEQYNVHVFKFIKQCRYCSLNHECPQCVYQNDDIREENVNCRNFCSRKEFDKKAEYTLDFLREHPHYYERILNEVVITH